MSHAQALGHLVQRSVSVLQAPSDGAPPPDPFAAIREQLSPTGIFVIASSIFILVGILSAVRYTLLGVVATLAQVEQPESNYVPLDANKDDPRAPLNENAADPEVVLVQATPVTGSIRRTLRHLTARAGFASRWRGIACALVTALAHSLVYQLGFNLLGLIMNQGFASLIAGVLASIAFARWYMAWTHIVISEPSSKRWFRRVPSFSTWRKIWAPTAINALASQFAFLIPAIVLLAGFGFNDPTVVNNLSVAGAAWRLIIFLLLVLVMYVGIVLPSQVALTRCQASLLPEEDESIIPFDRSYGGKVVPAIVGGTGMLSYIDAWKSFDRAARVRIVKLYAKIFAIDLALHLLLFSVLALELWLFMGKGVSKVPEGDDGQGSSSF